MKKLYLVHLIGIGEQEIKLVTKEVFDWIVNPETPGRKSEDEIGWIDETPSLILDEIRKDRETINYMTQNNGEKLVVDVTSSTYENDRALYAPSVKEFDSISQAMKYVKKNDIEIVDEYEGGIY